MGFNEKILEVQRLLEQVNGLLDRQTEALDATASALERYSKAAKLPSDFNSAQKQIKDHEKVRQELQKSLDANAAALAKKKAQMDKMFADMEAKRAKDLASQQAKTEKEIALYEKAAQKEIDANNRRTQAAEKRAAREAEIEQRKADKIIQAQDRLAAKQAALDAKYSRTGAASPVTPGLRAKGEDYREAERAALANEKLSRAYVELNMRRNEAKNRLQDLIASEKASTREIKIAQKEFDTLDAKVQKANRAVRQFSVQSAGAATVYRGLNNLMGAFGVATGLYLGADIVRNIYQNTKQLQSLDLALKMVSGSSREFAINQEFLRNLAEQYGIEIKGLTKNFTEFWVASKGKLEAEQIKQIFTSISKSVAVMGLSVEQQDAAFLALQQMMSKGTVQAEELKKQLGNALPGAMKAATMAYQELHPELKVTEKLFMEQMKLGKIISSELLPELAKAYEKLYGIEMVNRAETLQAAQERLSNSWIALIRSMNESETGGISKFFAIVVTGLDEMLKKVVRLNTSWSDLFKNAKSEGVQEGKSTFQFLFKELYKPISEKDKKAINERISELNDIIKNGTNQQAAEARGEKEGLISKLYWADSENAKEAIKEGAQERLALLRQTEAELMKEAEAFNRNPVQFALTTGRGAGDINKDREKVIKQIHEEAEIIRQATRKNGEETKRVNAEIAKETEKERKERLRREKELADELERLRKNKHAREMSDLEREKFLLEQRFEEDNTYAKDRIDLSEQIKKNELQAAMLTYLENRRLHKGSLDLIAKDANEFRTAQEKAEEASQKRIQKIKEDTFNKFLEYREKYGRPADEETYGIGVTYMPTDQLEEMISGFEKTGKAASKTKEEIAKAKDMLREFFQSIEGDFFSQAGFDKTYEMFFRLDEKGKSMFENLMAAAKETGQEFGVMFNAIAETAQETFNFISQASNANFENEYNNLERQRDYALLFAGDSAAARNEIERQYEEKRRAIRIREWQSQKQMALFNIAVDTAQAVVASVAKSPLTFGLPFSAFALAIGVAKAAIVSSQKMPQFWTGTDNAPEGLAWTQEYGREIIFDKDGNLKSMGSDKGPTATYLDRGDVVFNHKKTMDFLSFNKDLASMLSSAGIGLNRDSGSIDTSRLESKIDNLASTIAKKPTLKIVKDERGHRIYERRQAEVKEYVNGRLNYEQYDV